MTSRLTSSIAPVWKQVREPLYRNSLYVLAGQVGAAGLGALFWMLAARFLTADDVGIAVTANSAINLILSMTSLGLGAGIIRFAAGNTGEATKIVNACIGVGWPVALLAGGVFLAGIPVWAPGLAPVRDSLLISANFLVFTASYALLNLQTSTMFALQRGSFFFWRSVSVSVIGLLLILLLPRVSGGHGVAFLAYNLPVVLFLIVSSAFVLPRFFDGFRPLGSIDPHTVRGIARYTTANYLADLLWAVPNYILPILAANLLSVEAAAYFYMPWMVGNLVFAIPRAVAVVLFAQASSEQDRLQQSLGRASLLIFVLAVPVVGVLWLAGGTLLRAFGDRYVDTLLLRLILISVLPFAINSIAFAVLRVRRWLREIILLSASVAVACVGLSYVLVPQLGTVGLAAGWLLGQTTVAIAVLAWRTWRT